MSGGKRKRSKNKSRSRQYANGQWDLLNKTFQHLVDYARLPTEMAVVLRNPEVVAKVTDKTLLVDRAKLLCRDVSELTGELLELKQEHVGRKGEPKSSDDHMRCVDIHSRYVDWAEKYEAVVYPTYMAMNEQIGADLGVDVMAHKPTEAMRAPEQPEGKENDNE